ncbi:MAG: dipeptidase [Planctomycetota bacterium]|nr:dipeptidase [Planctomycetota bacterium]
MDRALEYLEQNRQRFLDLLLDYLRIPSVSAQETQHADARRAAEFIRSYAAGIGFETRLFEGDGLPTVHAWHAKNADAPTVLVYGHYDVQPPEPLELWESPPFEPAIRDGVIYARGCADDKGPSLAMVLAAECWLKGEDALPLNLHFIIEGEEECGGDVVHEFLKAHRDDLKADALVVSDSSAVAPGRPALCYGLRGLAAVEVSVHGPARDLHSGFYGGAVQNPATALARLVATLHEPGGRVAIDGFYDGVRELDDAERARINLRPYDEAQFLRETGSPSTFGEEGYTVSELRSARPTLEINGIFGGYQGPGMKTIIPASAACKITCRLVPDQDPEAVTAAVTRHLEAHCPPGVRLEIQPHHGARAVLTDPSATWPQRAARALEAAYGHAPVYTREGGSIPVLTAFQEILGLEPILIGTYSPDERAHSPNERYPVEDFYSGIRTGVHLYAGS